MRVFITDLHTTLGAHVAQLLQDADHQVLGSAPSKPQQLTAKRKLLSHAASDRADAVKEPVALDSDKPALAKLLRRADVVVVTNLTQNYKPAIELLKIFEKAAINPPPPDSDDDHGDGDGSDATAIKRFIALSSVLTWSKNAAFANAKDQRAHSEDDFKTRKPQRKYAELKTCETQILSANRVEVLETCVVAAGLQYGGAQSSFLPLFRSAWMDPHKELLVPVLPGASTTRGENLLPMISVYDLALLTSQLASAPSLPKSYIVATDKPSQSTTLRDVCVGLSVLLGNGKIRDQLTEDEAEALLVGDDCDNGDANGANGGADGGGELGALQLHLSFDGPSESSAMAALVPSDEFKHVASGLLSNLAFYVDDFVQCMDLRALKTVVLGPPRVGKTVLSQRLAQDYCLPYVTVETIAHEVLALRTATPHNNSDTDSAAAEAKPEQEAAEPRGAGRSADDDGEDEDIQLQQLRVELEAWRATSGDKNAAACGEDLPEATVVALLRWKLASAACRNQGFVLDGVPTSVAQAATIFELMGGHGDGGDGETGEAADADAKEEPPAEPDNGGADTDGDAEGSEAKSLLAKSRSNAILERLRPKKHIQFPNRVIVLHAPQELLEQRAQALSEQDAIATGNTQSQFAANLALFTAEHDALATFFEQSKPRSTVDSGSGVEVLELHLESEASYRDASGSLLAPVKTYMEQGGGKPHNFHPTREELRQMERDHARKKLEEDARLRQLEREQDERDHAGEIARMEAERARLEIIHREETELLEARAKPLRTYLMDTVLPALTEGMLEIVKVQPDDPIDYLAEFLFKKGRDLEAHEQERA